MKRSSLSLLCLGMLAGIAGSGLFESGKVAWAEDVNQNFQLLDRRLAELEQAFSPESLAMLVEILPHMKVVEHDNGQGQSLKALRFEGINVQIVNGLEATNGAPLDTGSTSAAVVSTNGLGNLIIGYAEQDPITTAMRTGSHNLVVGIHHGYSSFGGLVSGEQNTLAAAYTSVVGGQDNTASDTWASVVGGNGNEAAGFHTAVVGGLNNLASGRRSVVLGGAENEASGEVSGVSGGQLNLAQGFASMIAGGSENLASGSISTLSGGSLNQAMGYLAVVFGGQVNSASGDRSAVLGGSQNSAAGTWATVAGGCGITILDSCGSNP
jgi:hypothetical protein